MLVQEIRQGVAPRRWTVAEYERMVEAGVFAPGERVQLIEGTVFSMPPQLGPHASGVANVQYELMAVFRVGFVVRIQLPLELVPLSAPEPDAAVVRGSRDDYVTQHPRSAVLVVEVSDTTLAFDRGEKASLYAAHRIPDYWILNLIDHVLEVYRDPGPMPDQLSDHGYRERLVLRSGDRVAPLAAPHGSIPVADLLPRQPS